LNVKRGCVYRGREPREQIADFYEYPKEQNAPMTVIHPSAFSVLLEFGTGDRYFSLRARGRIQQIDMIATVC
jgi:hypothetical protein